MQTIVMFLIGVALLLAAPGANAEEVGAVAEMEGQAEILRIGTAAWTPLKPGDAVQLGDQVRTAAATSHFSLLVGAIRAVVTDRYGATGARFEVETPTAVAGVRGTGFITSYDETREETTVLGLFDTTGVRSKIDPNGQREVRVGPGQMTTVRRGAFPVRPSATPEGTLRSFSGSTEVRAKPEVQGKA